MQCVFCRATDDALLVADDEEGLILADRSPLLYGHLLVSSYEHVSSAHELRPQRRRALLHRVALAADLATALTGRRAIAVEHGRSPTCSDPSGATHAHIHVLPVGEFDAGAVAEWDAVSAIEEIGTGSYLAVHDSDQVWLYQARRHLLHAARSLASMVAGLNGVDWRPLAAGPDAEIAAATARDARTRLAAVASRPRDPNAPHEYARRRLRAIVVSGPTGSGKTTVAAALSRALEVPAVELGVILRLACATARPTSDAKLAGLLWRWHRKSRLDFEGVSHHRLAAAIPRLDGGGHEAPMWRDIEDARLAELARGEQAQEALAAIAASAAARGAVIVGRVRTDLSLSDVLRIELDAAPVERARRKRSQLRAIGVNAGAHDWFVPHRVARSQSAIAIDTTHLSLPAMVVAAREASLGRPPKRFEARSA